MDNNLLFVYGTLRDGMPNHPLMGGCSFVANAKISAKLFLSGWLPMIYPGDGVVLGEIYEIPDAEHWHHLDRLEGHPNWYRREEVEASITDDVKVKVWAYFMKGQEYPGMEHVENGDYVKLREGYDGRSMG